MRIQTFRAASIQEALQLVRENLGGDACILHTREVRRGLFSRRWIEVEASRDLSLAKRYRSERAAAAGGGNSIISQPLLAESGISGVVHQIRSELMSIGVDSTVTEQLVAAATEHCDLSQYDDINLLRSRIHEQIANRLKVSGDTAYESQRQRLVCLVGPTGVGKTSLLTKLAMQAAGKRQREIGIVSVNAWKNSSTDRLFHCADTIAAQLEMVSGVEQLAGALQRLQECDLVLIDTPGCSPQDDQQLGKLKEVLQFCQSDEAHLVLSANTASHIARLTIEEFSEIGATHLDIAKCDEATGLGQWISVLWTSALPVHTLSYGLSQSDVLTSPQPHGLAAILAGQAVLRLNRFETLFPVQSSGVALNGQYR